jgi:hypothetical protein
VNGRASAVNNCAIREYTADGVAVGRCWFYLRDGVCPRHGDVKDVQERYKASGELTDSREHKKGKKT